VVAHARGCVVRTGVAVSYYEPNSSLRKLAGVCSALALDGKRLLVVAERSAYSVSLDGKTAGTMMVGPDATALARIRGKLAVGYANGDVRVFGGAGPAASFEHTPAGAVTALVAGPRGTIAAGFASGELGLWHAGNGRRLDHGRLHGPVTHLAITGRRLLAASELGDHLTLDLTALYAERCGLMRHKVPLVSHECFTGRGETADE